MRIVVHRPTVTAPEGTGDAVAVVLAALHEEIRRLGGDDDEGGGLDGPATESDGATAETAPDAEPAGDESDSPTLP